MGIYEYETLVNSKYFLQTEFCLGIDHYQIHFIIIIVHLVRNAFFRFFLWLYVFLNCVYQHFAVLQVLKLIRHGD